MPEKLFRHPIFDVETFTDPEVHPTRTYVRLNMPDWVNIAAVTTEGALVLVVQHRFGIDAPTIEIPGGLMDPGESPSRSALRELREETGYGGGTLMSLGWVHPNPAIQDNKTFLYAALGVEWMGPPEPDDDEDISVHLLPLVQLPEWLARGKITHSLALNTLDALMRRREEPVIAAAFEASAALPRLAL